MTHAAPLFREAKDTPLPPLRVINHSIPLIDANKTYVTRRSKCPDVLRALWAQKRQDYIKTGRWEVATGQNAMPLLLLAKHKKDPSDQSEKIRLRTVVDLRQQNANTKKLSSPLPDIEGVLRRVAAKPYQSIIDGKDAYKQIRIIPEHVDRTIFMTPDGTMKSHVIQLGDCNGGATYQTLMNYLFQPYLGVWMDIYLDDIIIYSNTAEDHVQHLTIVLDILIKEQFFLSKDKMQIFTSELKILGHIVDVQGIRMDPHKVNAIAHWKTPTNADLLRNFLGAVGFLAPNIPQIRIPMGHLNKLIEKNAPYNWTATMDRAFEKVKELVQAFRHCH